MLSLEPDADMRWIYDPAHRDYNTPMAEHLRRARSSAIRSAPKWMVEEARINDVYRALADRLKEGT